MFFFLSKAIDFLIMPLSIVFVLLIYCVFTKSNHKRRQTAVVILVMLYLFSNMYLATKAFNCWEARAVSIKDLEQTYDVGILLSGGLVASDRLLSDRASLGGHGDRVLQMYHLYKANKIKKILITGSSSPEELRLGKGESRTAGAMMVQWGVAPGDIIYEEQARNTRENALFSSKILKEDYPNGKFVLVTSAFHMRRSMGCFKKAGIQADPFPADYYGGYNELTLRNGLIPNPAAISFLSVLWHEMTGFVIYKMMGYC